MTTHGIRSREGWLDPAGPPWEGFPNKDGLPYVCPPFRGWDVIDTIVIHYPGADWADMDFTNDGTIDLNDDIAQIRIQHRHYALNRKYSLGYCYLIGQTGAIWESRGIRNANAANLGDAAHGTWPPPWNDRTVSIQLIVDVDQRANAAQVDAVNWLIDWLISQRGRAMTLTYHGAGQATACPGQVRYQIISGEIGIGKSAPPQPPQPVPEDNMAKRTLFIPTDADAQFIGWGDEGGNAIEIVWVTKEVADAHRSVGVVVRDQLSSGGFRNCVLLGPVPVGDTRKVWQRSDFFRVVP